MHSRGAAHSKCRGNPPASVHKSTAPRVAHSCAATTSAASDLSKLHNSSNLAYLGDSLWSVYVRGRYLLPPKRFALYHERAVRHVAAEQQATYHDQLMAEDSLLTPEERRMLRWASAPAAGYRKRFKDSAAKQAAYDKATALEALVGYLHLEDPARLEVVLAYAGAMMDVADRLANDG